MTTAQLFQPAGCPWGLHRFSEKSLWLGCSFSWVRTWGMGQGQPLLWFPPPQGSLAVCNLTVLQLKTGSRRLPGGQETLFFHTVPGCRESRQELEVWLELRSH